MSEEPMQFTVNDVVGAVKQMMLELNSYMSRPVNEIDPRLCMGALERMTQFVGRLPLPADAVQNGTYEATEQRAN